MSQERSEEILRLEAELSAKTDQLKDRYIDMGKSLLELADSEQRAINAMVDDIIELKQKLAELKDQL